MKNIRKKTLAAVGILIVAILLFYKGNIINFFQIDRCLDQGGKWNYDAQICER